MVFQCEAQGWIPTWSVGQPRKSSDEFEGKIHKWNSLYISPHHPHWIVLEHYLPNRIPWGLTTPSRTCGPNKGTISNRSDSIVSDVSKKG